jgi:putative chitinase
MKITADQLCKILTIPQESIALTHGRCVKWEKAINDALEYAEANTLNRAASFIAQTAHESGRFVFVKELWGPTPAQTGYEGRKDLGNTVPGDGKLFRGRGLIQVTGRANYAKCAEALGLPLLVKPELLELPENAAKSAAWFWKTHGLNAIADTLDCDGVSDVINRGRKTVRIGDSNGYAERSRFTKLALEVLGT